MAGTVVSTLPFSANRYADVTRRVEDLTTTITA
jgi:hypothetical protein